MKNFEIHLIVIIVCHYMSCLAGLLNHFVITHIMHNRNASILPRESSWNSLWIHLFEPNPLNQLLWCLADQRARHHHGRRAGVCHPAQHHREAAVRPGECKKKIELADLWRNNGALFRRGGRKKPTLCELRSGSGLVLVLVRTPRRSVLCLKWERPAKQSRECCCGFCASACPPCERAAFSFVSLFCEADVAGGSHSAAENILLLTSLFPRQNREWEFQIVVFTQYILKDQIKTYFF